jgi:hypothetical protein
MFIENVRWRWKGLCAGRSVRVDSIDNGRTKSQIQVLAGGSCPCEKVAMRQSSLHDYVVPCQASESSGPTPIAWDPSGSLVYLGSYPQCTLFLASCCSSLPCLRSPVAMMKFAARFACSALPNHTLRSEVRPNWPGSSSSNSSLR